MTTPAVVVADQKPRIAPILGATVTTVGMPKVAPSSKKKPT